MVKIFPIKIIKIHFHILGLQISSLQKINQFDLDIRGGYVTKSWIGRLLSVTTSRLCTRNSLPELRCLGDLRDLDGMQVPRHCSSLLFSWSTPTLSTAHQSGVVVCILASLTAFSMMICALSLDACVPHQRRTYLSLQVSNQLSFDD